MALTDEERIRELELEISDYNSEKKHIKFTPQEGILRTYKLSTNVLRSRCRHTKQKDTGTAYIFISVQDAELDVLSLFKEIVALREVNEFHEFCAEKLHKVISSSKYVTSCMVGLLYSRRGSLDINPVRTTDITLLPEALVNTNIYTNKTQGQ
jgi:7-cyano-7-deazaguanine reductase